MCNVWLFNTHTHTQSITHTVHLSVLLRAPTCPAQGKATVTYPSAAHLHLSGSILSLRLSWQKIALGTESTMGAEERSGAEQSLSSDRTNRPLDLET